MVERLIVLDSPADHPLRGPSFFPAGYASLPLHRGLSVEFLVGHRNWAHRRKSTGNRGMPHTDRKCYPYRRPYLVAPEKDLKQIIRFGDILRCGDGSDFGCFSFGERSEHLRGCWDIGKGFSCWLCFVVHTVKEVMFHIPIVDDYTLSVKRKNVVIYIIPKFFPLVDHDHGTLAVRGILCNDCNLGLSRFKDDPARIRQALAYLEAPRG